MNSFAEFLTLHARKHPEKFALVFGDKRLSYEVLNTRVNALANALLSLGVQKGDKLAILLHNGNEIVESVFACAKIGAVSISMNFRLVGREFTYILDNCDASILVYGHEFEETIGSIRSDLSKVKRFIRVGDKVEGKEILQFEELIQGSRDTAPEIQVSMDDDSSIIYTSGTTGQPKGVLRSHRSNLWAPLNQVIEMGLGFNDIELYMVPLFNVGFFNYFTPNIVVGSTTVVLKEFNPKEVLKIIERERVTRVFMVPTMWNRVMMEMDSASYDVGSLKVGSSGAESCPLAIKERIMEYFEGIETWEAYGLSEGGVTLLPPKDAIRKIGSVGKATATNEANVINDEGGAVSPGEVGEVIFRGPSLMKGYYKNPEATEEALREGWLRTGDLARVDEEGYLYIVDRKKDMIVSGGENIYPKEIEEVLFKHPKITEAAVIGVPDSNWGEAVKAVIVVKEGEQLSEEEVISFSKTNLASYKKPRSVDFVDMLPRNPSGKVLKTELKAKYKEDDNS